MGIFDSMGGQNRGGSMSPIAMAVLGVLAYRTLKGKGRLGEIFGTSPGAANPAGSGAAGTGTATPASTGPASAAAAASAAPGGGLLGSLGAGGLGAGLKDLLDRFRQTGHEEHAQSWVSQGANRPIAPNELEDVLGGERVQWLMEQTGMSKEQLLAGLSKELPGAVDELTPNGQVPTEEEIKQRFMH